MPTFALRVTSGRELIEAVTTKKEGNDDKQPF